MGKKVYVGFDFSEDLSIQEWSKVILELNQAGYTVNPEEVTKKTGVEVDEAIIAMPENKSFSIMNMYDKLLKNSHGKNNR